MCELLIAGFLYIADFGSMLQLRRNDPSRHRRIKRDLYNVPKKGIAGLRLNAQQGIDEVVREIRGAERPASPASDTMGIDTYRRDSFCLRRLLFFVKNIIIFRVVYDKDVRYTHCQPKVR